MECTEFKRTLRDTPHMPLGTNVLFSGQNAERKNAAQHGG